MIFISDDSLSDPIQLTGAKDTTVQKQSAKSQK